MNGGHQWRTVMDEFQFNVVLVGADTPIAALLRNSAGWRVIQGDDNFVLFEREKKG